MDRFSYEDYETYSVRPGEIWAKVALLEASAEVAPRSKVVLGNAIIELPINTMRIPAHFSFVTDWMHPWMHVTRRAFTNLCHRLSLNISNDQPSYLAHWNTSGFPTLVGRALGLTRPKCLVMWKPRLVFIKLKIYKRMAYTQWR